MRRRRERGGVISFASFHFGSPVRTNAVRSPGKGAPELLAHQADQRRALVHAVVARHDLEHLEVARRGRERADLDPAFHHIQILYKTCIRRQAALRASGGGRSFRQRSIHSAVSFSCTPFCIRRWARAAKSTWSSGWCWLEQEETEGVSPLFGSTCGCRHWAQISFIMHCIGLLIEPIATCSSFRKSFNTLCLAWATAAIMRSEPIAMMRSAFLSER